MSPGGEVKKKKRFEENAIVPEPGQPSPGQLTNDKVSSDHIAGGNENVSMTKLCLSFFIINLE